MANAPVIGLLGGGQLGRMFLENALRYDVEVHVLDPDPHAPCASLASRFVIGDFRDAATVIEFGRQVDIVGIEIEQVSVDALRELKRLGKRVIPDPDVLAIIQDKGEQKQFYAKHGLPTAPFVLLDTGKDLEKHASLLPAFLKTRTGGYDGKGVMAIDGTDSAGGAFTGACLLEQRADIEMELAVLVVRDDRGNEVAYDPVEMVFDPVLNLVDHLQAPARPGAAVNKAARSLACEVAAAFGQPGIYAVEMFLTKAGELLVNETAPRAHNSGHHTIEACASSQFDQLLRVYMAWPLGDARLRSSAAMVNLVGADGAGAPSVRGLDHLLALPEAHLHLYGKAETRTGRKMGHVTLLSPDQARLDDAVRIVKRECAIVPRERKEPRTTDITGTGG